MVWRKAILILAALWHCSTASAQKDRYKFAQTYIGVQADYLTRSSASIPDMGAGRLTIGGTHFWGCADFYISFPIHTFALERGTGVQYTENVITGGRWLPIGLKSKFPVPFAGVQWINPSFSRGSGPTMQRSHLGLEAGLSLVVKRRYTIECSMHYVRHQMAVYADSRVEFNQVILPELVLSVGVKKYFDFTAGNGTPEGKAAIEQADERIASAGARSAWSVDIGLSVNAPLRPFDFARQWAYLPEKTELSLHPDVSAGYYLHKADAALRAAWRPVHASQKGHGTEWKLRSHRISAEAFKFIFDYHGFVPFIGIGAGYTHHRLRISEYGEGLADESAWQPEASIVFGWDIRPTQSEWFILRTNLRYVMSSGVKAGRYDISNRHLEVNFIQFVYYPKRLKSLK